MDARDLSRSAARRKRPGVRLVVGVVLLTLAAVAAPQWVGGRVATADAAPDLADERPSALLARVEAVCPVGTSGARSEECRLLRHDLDRRLAERHRSLADAAISSRDFAEADRQFRLALTYAGFETGAADQIRRAVDGAARDAAETLEGSQLYAARIGSVVQVRMSDRIGSGVVAAPGVVLTNAHVLGDQEEGLIVTASGEELRFTSALEHPFADVALVRVPELRAEPAPLGAGLALRPGDGVSLIGSPQGLAFSFSNGAVSAVGRRLDDEQATMIQFTAPISQGSSGAPLFDERGRVAALASLFFDEGQALNFAVPIEYGMELMEMAARL